MSIIICEAVKGSISQGGEAGKDVDREVCGRRAGLHGQGSSFQCSDLGETWMVLREQVLGRGGDVPGGSSWGRDPGVGAHIVC